jgi:hypothetical protein
VWVRNGEAPGNQSWLAFVAAVYGVLKGVAPGMRNKQKARLAKKRAGLFVILRPEKTEKGQFP